MNFSFKYFICSACLPGGVMLRLPRVRVSVLPLLLKSSTSTMREQISPGYWTLMLVKMLDVSISLGVNVRSGGKTWVQVAWSSLMLLWELSLVQVRQLVTVWARSFYFNWINPMLGIIWLWSSFHLILRSENVNLRLWEYSVLNTCNKDLRRWL